MTILPIEFPEIKLTGKKAFLAIVLMIIVVVACGIHIKTALAYTTWSYGTTNTSIIANDHDVIYWVDLNYFDTTPTGNLVVQSSSSDIIGQLNFLNINIPANATIDQADLILRSGTYASPYYRSITVYGVDDDITHNNITSYGDMSSSYSSNFTNYPINTMALGDHSIDVTTIIQEIIDDNELTWNASVSDIALKILGSKYSDLREFVAYEGGNPPRLEISYSVPHTVTEGDSREEYGDYVIITTGSVQGMPGYIMSNDPDGSNSTLLMAKSINDINTSAPFYNFTVPFLIDAQNFNNPIGGVYDGQMYIAGMNTSTSGNVDIWSSAVTDLTTWIVRGVIDITSATTDSYYAMVIDQDTGYLHYFETKKTGTYWANMSLTTYTASTAVQVTDGYSSGGASNLDVEIDSNGGLHVVAGHPQSASAVNKVYYNYKPAGQPWEGEEELPSGHSAYTSSYPEIHTWEGYYHIYYLDGSNPTSGYTRYVHNPIGNMTMPAYETVISNDGVSQGYKAISFIYEDFFSGNYNDDILVYLVNLDTPNPDEIAYVYTYQSSPTNFTTTTIAEESAGFCNFTYYINPMVWEFGGTQAMTASWYGDSLKTGVNPFNLPFWKDVHVIGDWATKDLSTVPYLANTHQANPIINIQVDGDVKVKDENGNTVWTGTDVDDVKDWIDSLVSSNRFSSFGTQLMDVIGLIGIIVCIASIYMGIMSFQMGSFSGGIIYFAGGLTIGYGLIIAWLGG